MKIALASSSLYAVKALDVLERSNHEVVGFITMPDRPQGRSSRAKPNQFRAWASRERVMIPCYAPDSADQLLEALRQIQADLVVTLAYGRLVKEEALQRPKYGWLNIHFSILPRWRGAAPVQRSLLAGERESGVTIFKLDVGMDTGPIYRQRSYLYGEDECASEALDQMSLLGADEILRTIEMIEAGVKPREQEGLASIAGKIAKDELRLILGLKTEEMMRQIRAFTSNPGVWFIYNGQRMIISKAKSSSEAVASRDLIERNGSLFLGTEDGSIEILRIIPEGKREMSGSEFARGRDLKEASRIE